MNSKLHNNLEKEKFLITSVSSKDKTPNSIEKKSKNYFGSKTARADTEYFPKLTYASMSPNIRNNFNYEKINSNFKKKKKQKNDEGLKKIELFIKPINRSVKEINNLRALKENLVKKRFNELHKFKLQINPNNYYHNYGLNDYIIITHNNRNKRNHSYDYKYNNISSYNNMFVRDEIKKTTINMNKNKFYRNIKINNFKKNICLLKNIPNRIKNKNKKDFIINSFNDEKYFENNNSLWRGKNINDIISNKTNINFFKNFIKNSKKIGKIKLEE